jgi:integrase
VRDKAIILFMADSGLRRGEVVKLNWSDVDMSSGLVRVKQGKGRKDRFTVIGAKTRRALLAYRRTLDNREGELFQTAQGTRFTGNGLMLVFRRLSKRTRINITAHAMRRTFAILSLRAGMRPLHLQVVSVLGGRKGDATLFETDGKHTQRNDKFGILCAQLGFEGWELVAASPRGDSIGSKMNYIFKGPLPAT